MWNKIIGHERQKEQLRRAIASGNVPHAYLLSGVDGIGKKLVAFAAASDMLGAPLTDGQFHPDMIVIRPEKEEITIAMIRDVRDQLKFAPLKGARRITVMDQAETMNASAANAALKILEEPPSGNHFFLITSTPSNLLPTIISRCQSLQFSPLTNEQIEACLVKYHGYLPEQARLAAAISEGSMGRSLTITPELIDSVVTDLKKILSSKQASDILEISAKWYAEREKKGAIEDILYIIHKCFHNALVQKSGTRKKNTETEIERLTSLILSNNDMTQLMKKCDQINRAHAQIARTYNKQLMFEQLLFTLALP